MIKHKSILCPPTPPFSNPSISLSSSRCPRPSRVRPRPCASSQIALLNISALSKQRKQARQNKTKCGGGASTKLSGDAQGLDGQKDERRRGQTGPAPLFTRACLLPSAPGAVLANAPPLPDIVTLRLAGAAFASAGVSILIHSTSDEKILFLHTRYCIFHKQVLPRFPMNSA